jgi:hypothetical protein
MAKKSRVLILFRAGYAARENGSPEFDHRNFSQDLERGWFYLRVLF